MDVLRIGIIEFCRTHPNTAFCPSEVVKKMYPQSWRHFSTDIRVKAIEMYRQDEIHLTVSGKAPDKENIPKGPIMISRLK